MSPLPAAGPTAPESSSMMAPVRQCPSEMTTEIINLQDHPRKESPSAVTCYRQFWVVALLVFSFDHLTKAWVVYFSGFTMGHYPPFGGKVLIEGFFNLVYAVNYGAAWGILQGFSWLLIALAFGFTGLLYAFRKDFLIDLENGPLIFGLICGGIFGNTLDRLLRGHVVDFLDFTLPFYRWPTFNIADSAIVVGTIWYLVRSFRHKA